VISAQKVKHKALDLGFDAAGITGAAPLKGTHTEHFNRWLASGCAGGMAYMHRNLPKRLDPAKLLEGARSVVCVALNYQPPAEDVPLESAAGKGRVCNYARYIDYHDFLRGLLRTLAAFVQSAAGGGRFQLCVDSAPAAERALAARAGLGFIGKNHMLINPTLGPQVFLGEVITTVEIQADEPHGGSCGDCRKCLDVCPAGALREDGLFDASRCISYLTIEHRGVFPAERAAVAGDCLFGCDRCVAVCPYTAKAPVRANENLAYRPELTSLDLNQILAMNQEQFDEFFAGSPIKRLGLARLKRNARVCRARVMRANMVEW